MILFADLEAAVRCPRCGQVSPGSFSLFDMTRGRAAAARCACGQELVRLRRWRGRGFVVEVACAVCEERHTLPLPAHQLLAGPPVGLACAWTEVELGFLGRRGAARAAAEELADDLARAGAEYANIEEHLVSPGLMADILGFLHRLTQGGKLSSFHENGTMELTDLDS